MSHLAAESPRVLGSFSELKPVRVVFDEKVADDSTVLVVECDRTGVNAVNLGGYQNVLGGYGQLDVRDSTIRIIVADDVDPDDALRRLRNEVAPRYMLIGRPWLNGELQPGCSCGSCYTKSFVEGGIDVDQRLSDDQIAKLLDLKTKLTGVEDIKIDDNHQTISVDFNLYSGANRSRAARTLRRLATAMQVELEAPVKILTDDENEDTLPRDYLGESLLQGILIAGSFIRPLITVGRLPRP